MGSQPLDSTRPDAEPTINEAGQQGFAIDGTDSFSVPGPADGLPPDPGDEDAMARIAAMRRLLVTLGTAVAVLLVVIIVGRTGGSGPSDRLAGATEGPAFTLPSPFGDPTSRGRVDRTATAESDAASPTYDDEFASPSSRTVTSQFDDLQYDGGTFPSYTVTSDPYSDDQFDDFDDDYDVPYVPSRTTPRTFPRYTPPVVNRSRPPVPGADETEETDPEDTTPDTVPPTTPETTATTSTTSTTTTTTTTTTTVPPAPVAAWKALTTPLGVVCTTDQVRLWADHQSLLAGIGARALRSADGGATWTPIPLGSAPTAYAGDPGHPGSAWIASSTGVFELKDGELSRIGDLVKVTSLSAAGTGPSPTLVAVNDGTVQRWVDAATGWTATAALPDGAVAREVVALDADSFLVGTDKGVTSSDDGGTTYLPLQGAGVKGAPARSRAVISWLLADEPGVLRNTGPGGTWVAVPAAEIAPDATTLTFVPALGLVTTGAQLPLVSSVDGVTWDALKVQPPYHPDGIARAGSGVATMAWASTCGHAGQPSAADVVLRLADSGP